MARPCGCGSGGLIVRCGTGVLCSGLGTTSDPLVLQWEIPLGAAACDAVMNCVGGHLGNGLGLSNGVLGVRLAPAGGIEFDGSGALRATGVTPGGRPATVPALEAMTQDVVGGAMGAGFMIKPMNLMRSFEYGLSANLHFMHVPVRFLQDGTPVVWFYETMVNALPQPTVNFGDHVQDQVPHRWKEYAIKPGYQFENSGNDPIVEDFTAPWRGWFGYLENGERSLLFLSDVLKEFGGKIVLVLDLRYPALNADGTMGHNTPSWRPSIFRDRIRWMIQDLGLSSSVIITTTLPLTPAFPDGIPATNVLDYFADAGITVGPFLETAADAAKYPPATWNPKWSWVFLSSTIPSGTLRGYVTKTIGTPAKPLNVILFYVTRQYLRDTVVNNAAQTPGATGVGAKGVISADPEYYLARSQYRYRKGENDWFAGTVDHGLLPHEIETPASAWSERRGYHQGTLGSVGGRSLWMGPGHYKPADPIASTGFTLQGWMCPAPPVVANNRSYDFGFTWGNLPALTSPDTNYGWMAVAFCVPTDHVFQNYEGTTPPAGGDYTLSNGYILIMDTNAYVFMYVCDQGKITSLVTQARPFGVTRPANNTPYYMRLGINATGIKVSKIGSPGGTLGVEIFHATGEPATRYRGGYFYAGRRCLTTWTGRVDDLRFSGGTGAPPVGP